MTYRFNLLLLCQICIHMERLPDLIHWKRRGSTEDWRVSSFPHIYLSIPITVGILVVLLFPGQASYKAVAFQLLHASLTHEFRMLIYIIPT